MARLLQPFPDTSPDSTSVIDKPDRSFRGLGLTFTPIRPAHLDFIAWVMGRKAPEIDRIYGQTMVSREFTPLGVALAYFEDDGTVSIHAYFGRWLRTYPKDILRSMQPFMQRLRDTGNKIVYAVADGTVDGSKTLIDWLGGEDTGRRHELGPIYRIDLTRTKI